MRHSIPPPPTPILFGFCLLGSRGGWRGAGRWLRFDANALLDTPTTSTAVAAAAAAAAIYILLGVGQRLF